MWTDTTMSNKAGRNEQPDQATPSARETGRRRRLDRGTDPARCVRRVRRALHDEVHPARTPRSSHPRDARLRRNPAGNRKGIR